MHSLHSIFSLGLLFSQLVAGAPSPIEPLEPRDLQAKASTCNTATNRSCWSDGFDINTDYEFNFPLTGATKSFTLTLTEETDWTGPDGVKKELVMLVNGDIIGPTITADWGDTISVRVINKLATNGTSIHWHGIRQLNSNLHDGVNGVTECPIPPNGGERVYTFIARQYGTTWYHSHFSAQYGNGIVGAMVINGPASLPYEVDLGPLVLTDYYYRTADELVAFTKTNGAPPADNVLFNGLGKHPTTGVGEYAKLTLTKGKRHRLRLINTSVENHFQVSIANHSMTIIAADLVPVNAQTVDSLFLAVGQRYDVTIDASNDTGNFWLNVTFGGQGFCGLSNNPNPAAIIHYDGAPDALPTYPGVTPKDHQCLDLPNLTPVVRRDVDVASFAPSTENTLNVTLALSPTFVWRVNGSDILINWNKPVVQYVLNNETDYPAQANIWNVEEKDKWAYWLIENDPDGAFSLPHPIHLHGHDFVVLGRSQDSSPGAQVRHVFDPTQDQALLRGSNPVRRDVAMLPAKGWLLLAFRTDNPGAWLMHCHIAWHISGGLGVIFLERTAEYRDRIPSADADVLDRQCVAWSKWMPTGPKDDSGLRTAVSGV